MTPQRGSSYVAEHLGCRLTTEKGGQILVVGRSGFGAGVELGLEK